MKNPNIFYITLLFFFLQSCSSPIPKPKIPVEDFFTCVKIDNKKNSFVSFLVKDKIVHYEKSDLGAIFVDNWNQPPRTCNCNFPLFFKKRSYKVALATTQNSSYDFIQAYRDSQLLHQGNFLQHCESTAAINQAFINADVKAGEYSTIELAEILKRWGEPHYFPVRTPLDSILKHPTDISHIRPCSSSPSPKYQFISNYDSAFAKITAKIQRLNCNEFIYRWAEPKDSLINAEICAEFKKYLQPQNPNIILILDYVDVETALYARLAMCAKNTESNNWADAFCLPDFIYQFEIYDKDGFVQVKKKILNGYNLFLR